MGRKTRFYLPGFGYIDDQEKAFVLKELKKMAPLIEAGVISHEEARETVIARLRERRAARKFFDKGARGL